MKILALYLPQYHSFPENDEWWGKDYTEWTALKGAAPVFKGQSILHPKDGYYDLVNDQPETFIRQAGEARKYGIDGFAVYRYYFTGKQLMEKPMEILLNHPEIDMPYCFAWANETWTRAWYDLKEEVLMPQEYGGEQEWRAHFECELPYFKDKRYIKKDNKPVYIIYRTFDIDCLPEMKAKWDEWARKEGFDGIFWIGGRTAGNEDTRKNLMDAYYYFEPGYTLKHGLSPLRTFLYNSGTLLRHLYNALPMNREPEKKILERRIPIDWIYEGIVSRQYERNEYPGLIAQWDNTPRRSYKGLVYTQASAEKFRTALNSLKKTLKDKESYVFINAWNEWGEGAALEPSLEKGDALLKAIREVREND